VATFIARTTKTPIPDIIKEIKGGVREMGVFLGVAFTRGEQKEVVQRLVNLLKE